MGNIIRYNIGDREAAEKTVVYVHKQDADDYEETGNYVETKYTGEFGSMCSLAQSSLVGEGNVTATVRRIEGNMAELTVREAAVKEKKDDGEPNPGESEDAPSWQVSTATNDEPIQTHPKYAKFPEVVHHALKMYIDGAGYEDQVKLDGKMTTIKAVLNEHKSDELVECFKKIYQGKVTYLAATTELTARYKIPGLKSLKEPGRIAEPPGNYPTPKKRNWLLIGQGIEHDGRDLWVSETYRLSGPDGWDKDLYGI